jgi:hypothetical protein
VLTQSLAFFEFVAFVDEQRHVAAVIDDELRALAAGMARCAFQVQSQYSSSVSPFQAKTGVPAAAMAAAAWSCVEKMLHEAQRTSRRVRPASR